MIRRASTYTLDLFQASKQSLQLVGDDALNHTSVKSFIEFMPRTYVITSLAFDDFLVTNDLIAPIFDILQEVRIFDRNSAENASRKIQHFISQGIFPSSVKQSISQVYKEIQAEYNAKTISLEFSHVIEKRFIPEADRNFALTGIRKESDLLDQIKNLWKRFFSADAIELRTNGYYDGPLTLALMLKKTIRSELSGKAYSIPPITKEEDTIEIYSVYGIVEEPVDYENFADVYKIDIKDLSIKEKHIVPQEYMLVDSGNLTEDNNRYERIEISNSWRKRQKLEDESVIEIGKKLMELEKSIDKPLIVYFSVESGKVYLTDILIDEVVKNIDPAADDDEQDFISKFDIEDKRANKDYSKNKPDLDALEQEINDIIKNDDKYIRDERSQDNNLPLIINPKRERSLLPYPKWTEKYRLITDIYLDISRINVENLSSIELFNGTFFSGTEFIIENKVLPEETLKTKHERLKYIDRLALEIMSLSKATGVEPLIYSLSNITDYEYKLLGKNSEKSIGDERFISSPDALSYEILAIQKAKADYACENISISVPNVRNVRNLEDIKSIISSLGVRRSTKLKLYAELSVPSFAYDISNLSEGLVDGIIIDYDVLLKLLVYREDIREIDHEVIVALLNSVNKVVRDKGLELILKLGDVTNSVLKNIIKLKPHGIIFSYMPKEEFMKFLKNQEEKIFKGSKNFFTKI